MRIFILAVAVSAFGAISLAQSTLNNDSVVKMVKSGLSDDIIITTINASPGSYDTSVDGLIALKNAGISNRVVAALVGKSSSPQQQPPMTPGGQVPGNATPQPPSPGPSPIGANAKPRLFLEAKSSGDQWNAARDQSMEMSKDFEQVCPEVRISLNQANADYTVSLNHIEHGFARDNQIQIANRDGDLINKTKEGGSIKGAVKKACDLIIADWMKK